MAVLFCALVLVGYYYLYYKEASQRIATLETTLGGLQSKIKEQQAIAQNLRSFQEEVQRLEQQLSLLLEQLPNSAEIPSLLKSVSDLGKESGWSSSASRPAGGEEGFLRGDSRVHRRHGGLPQLCLLRGQGEPLSRAS